MISHACSVQNLARTLRLRFGGMCRTKLRRWRSETRRLLVAGLLCTAWPASSFGAGPPTDTDVIPVAHSSVKIVDDKNQATAAFVDRIPLDAPTTGDEAESTARFLTGKREEPVKKNEPDRVEGRRTLVIDSVRARIIGGKVDVERVRAPAEPVNSANSSKSVEENTTETPPANLDQAKTPVPEDRLPPMETIVSRPRPSTSLRRETLPTAAPELTIALKKPATVAKQLQSNSDRPRPTHSNLARPSSSPAERQLTGSHSTVTNDRHAATRDAESNRRSPVVNFLRNILPHESKENVMWGPAHRQAYQPAFHGPPPPNAPRYIPPHHTAGPTVPIPQTRAPVPQYPAPSPAPREMESPQPRLATSRESPGHGVAVRRTSDAPRLARKPEAPTAIPEEREDQAVEEKPAIDATEPGPAASRSILLRATPSDDAQTQRESPTSHSISDTFSSRRDSSPNKVRRISVKEMVRERKATEELRKPSRLRIAPRPAAAVDDQSQHATSHDDNELVKSDDSNSRAAHFIRTVSHEEHEETALPRQRSAPEVRFVVLQSVDQTPPRDDAPVPPNIPSIPTAGNDSLRPIGDVQASIRAPEGEFPFEPAEKKFAQFGTLQQPMGTNRPWSTFVVHWEAAALCHGGLVFEEVNLERYGYSHGLAQPILSAAHFFGRAPAIPYLTIAEKPHGCTYTLGHYRPGSWAPYQRHFPPFSPPGALGEAAAVAGLILLIP